MPDVKLGATWLRSLGHVSEVKWSTRWGLGPCGPALASCALAVDPANDTSMLRLGQTVELSNEGVKVLAGPLAEMGRDFPRAMSFRSWASRAADFDAIDATGEPTTNPRTAVTQAIARGLPWSNPSAFDDVSLGVDGTPSVVRLNILLDNWAVTAGKRWGTDANGVAFATTDPMTPTWYLDASDLDIGTADDGLYTRIRARYVDSVDMTTGDPDGWASAVVDDTVAQAIYGVIEYPMDLTALGLITSTVAGAYAQQQLALLTVPQWLSQVTTNSSRLLTAGGHGAHLPSVRAGQMVRLFNVPNTLGGLRNELGLDVVLGEVEYDTENPTAVTIAPIGLAVRNLADVSAQAAKTAAVVGVVPRAPSPPRENTR